VPLNFEKENLGNLILERFNLKPKKKDLKTWRQMVNVMKRAKKTVKIGIVGKYFNTGNFTLADSYISVIEAIKHGSWVNKVKPILSWISTDEIKEKGVKMLKNYDGIIIPQGWGSRGAEEKIKAIQYLRVNKIPYLGLCYGMQMAVIEFARHVCGLRGANSEEVDPKTKYPVIHIMPEQKKYLREQQYGGTIRLGAWPSKLKPKSRVAKIYGTAKISERHRHRYEFNHQYRSKMEKQGLTIAGTSPDGKLVECISIEDHPFFIGTQFHPEYKSRPLRPHPLFIAFVRACLITSKHKDRAGR
jgi:CTP synthase